MPEDAGSTERTARYKDPEVLNDLYWERGLSTNQMAEKLDCCGTTVRTWMEKNDIERRSISEAKSKNYVPFHTMKGRGHEQWCSSEDSEKTPNVYVHRLLAVAEYGFDIMKGNVVHHKNGIKWDNRPENIGVMTQGKHMKEHSKVGGLDRIRLAELYENGDISMRDLAEHVDHDITMGVVLNAHREFYGDDDQ